MKDEIVKNIPMVYRRQKSYPIFNEPTRVIISYFLNKVNKLIFYLTFNLHAVYKKVTLLPRNFVFIDEIGYIHKHFSVQFAHYQNKEK